MGEDLDPRACEAEAVDQAGVIESVAVDRLAGLDERAEDTDIELKTAREQHGVLAASERGQTGFDGTVFRKVATDQARSCCAAGSNGGPAQLGVVGQAQVIVAAEADHRAVVEVITNALAMGDRGWTSGEAPAFLVRELFRDSAVQGSRHA